MTLRFDSLMIGDVFTSANVGPNSYKKISARKALNLEHGEAFGLKHGMTFLVKPSTLVDVNPATQESI